MLNKYICHQICFTVTKPSENKLMQSIDQLNILKCEKFGIKMKRYTNTHSFFPIWIHSILDVLKGYHCF